MENYELRPLKASDMGAICKIISAIGVREFKTCFNIEDFRNKSDEAEENVEKIGFGIVFDIAGIVIENIPNAEKEIQSFLASVTGKKINEIQSLSLADYGELIMEVIMKEDFRDFFSRVMKLFNR